MPASEKNHEKHRIVSFSSRRQNGIHFVGLSSGEEARIVNTEVIGLDVGQKRTGIARASMVAKLAESLLSVPTEQLIEKLKALVKQNKVDAIVVGLPRNLEGQDTAQTKWVRQWVNSVKKEIPIATFYLQDEALTSKIAISKNQKAKSSVDRHALAAAIILQDWLDAPNEQRQVA